MNTAEVITKRLALPLVKILPDRIIKPHVSRYFVEVKDKNSSFDEVFDASHKFRTIGINPIFDILGESQFDIMMANSNKEKYVKLLRYISSCGSDTLYRRKTNSKYNPEISIKLSMLGLDPEGKNNLHTFKNVKEILEAGKDGKTFIRIDMEDLRYVDNTIKIYKDLRYSNFDNVGIVLQSRLKRTQKDLEDLLDFEPDVRVVKGAYHNEAKDKVFLSKAEVDSEYLLIVYELLNNQLPVEIATMDKNIIERSLKMINEFRFEDHHEPKYSFSMLYGTRDDELINLASEHNTKVYIPFGCWKDAKAYSFRRLDENPLFFLDTIKRKIKELDF